VTGEFNLFHAGYLLQGAVWTLLLAVIAILGGGVLGLVVAIGRVARPWPVRLLAGAYVQVIQGTPLLILMFIAFFGLSILGITLPALVAAGVALVLYSAAFLGEIWRGCFQAVPQAQHEAGAALGLRPFAILRLIVLPQAVRIAVPPTVGFLVQVVKNTSIASIVGFTELARAGQIVNNATFQPFLCFTIVAGIYFLLCYPLSCWARALERRLVPA